jgi:hypothetical protein
MSEDHIFEWHLGQRVAVEGALLPHTGHRLSAGFAGAGLLSVFFLLLGEIVRPPLPMLIFTMLTVTK